MYANEKYSKNKKAGFGNTDLTLTGALGEGISIRPLGSDKIEIFSKDEKYNKIVEDFGEWNFNVSDKEWEFLVTPILIKVIEDIFNRVYQL